MTDMYPPQARFLNINFISNDHYCVLLHQDLILWIYIYIFIILQFL